MRLSLPTGISQVTCLPCYPHLSQATSCSVRSVASTSLSVPSAALLLWASASPPLSSCSRLLPGAQVPWAAPDLVCRGCHTKYPRLGAWTTGIYSHCSGGRKSEIKARAGLVSPEGSSLLGSQTATFLPCPHVAAPQSVCVCLLIFSSYKDTGRLG